MVEPKEKPKPSEQAWRYFTTHLKDIRACIENFGTRTTSGHDQEMHEPLQMADWDKAVEEQDVLVLHNMMNDAWYKAPDRREVYQVPGFSEMCNLLDGTVEGFRPEQEYDDEAEISGVDD